MWLGLGTLLAGIPVMFWWNSRDHAFFRVKPDPIDSRPSPDGGHPLPPLVPEGAPPLWAGVLFSADAGKGGLAPRPPARRPAGAPAAGGFSALFS